MELMFNTARPNVQGTKVLQAINTTFVFKIVQSIDGVHHFHTLILYITEKLRLSTPGAVHFFNQMWLIFPLVPRIIVRNNEGMSNTLRDMISTPSLVLVLTTDRTDPIMEVASKSLTSRRWLKTIFILFPYLSSGDIHNNFTTFTEFSNICKNVLRWAWEKQFINSFLLTIGENVYQLDPYPTESIVNYTQVWQDADFFRPLNRHMNKYVVSTPVMYDMPRVFKGADQKTIFGSSAKLFLGFLDYVNATLKDTSADMMNKEFDLPYLLELVSQGVYETLIHSYTDLAANYSTSFSYPIAINDWCLMVPFRNGSMQELYVKEALEDDVWLILIAIIFYMGVSIWICTPNRPRDFSAALLQCVCSLTNMPPIAVIKIATLRMRYLFAMFSIMGLVGSNMYVSKMTSYFTTALQEEQVNSMQDVIDANLRILVVDYEYEALASMPEQYSPRFMQQVDMGETRVVQRHRDKLNATYGYFMSSDRWETIDMLQRNLRVPVFKLTSICSGPFYHVYPLPLDSHLRSPLQEFILIAQESGLRHHWKWEAFWEAMYMGVYQWTIVNESPVPLSMSFFSSMMRTWCVGLVLAGLTFILEMKWHQHVFEEYCLKSYNKLRRIFRRRRRAGRR
ncbi:uncharacterized protein LOC6568735 [Drosophila grimshawi]|uniref:GH22769 n=1 Tax=Drosophila grimshawi TaxID=7222 RepID=B4JWB4_DROGR|nr:uncharacterized protein LOC6568735 [Drosophila grimshawi]EDV98252.1 GH22769 [Drosophila grimshawi]